MDYWLVFVEVIHIRLTAVTLGYLLDTFLLLRPSMLSLSPHHHFSCQLRLLHLLLLMLLLLTHWR